ncbi:MAG TPA: phosphotransferase [Candidatus Binatia bacterium]|nr:phosphotransferase [Candidatus Binatia bacterium]
MEPPLPPLHPRVPELLEHLNLRVVDAIKWNVLSCTEAGDKGTEPTLILKFGSDRRKAESIAYETRILSEVLPTLDQSGFERLVLPEYVNDGIHEGLRWMTMRYIKGEPLVYEWSELTFKPDILGGKGINVAVARSAVDVLRDLRLVDIGSLPKFVRKFDFKEWLDGFHLKSETLVSQGIMEASTVENALRHFSAREVERYEGSMFTNGDFYPRNFIFLPKGKIAVVDWVGGIDPWEFVAMYAWLLMWGNPAWQQSYVSEIKKHFPVDLEEMQIGLLVKAFDQVYRWREQPEEYIGFARTQMLAYFHQCLDIDYVRKIFS